jgi:hypothetical protein
VETSWKMPNALLPTKDETAELSVGAFASYEVSAR